MDVGYAVKPDFVVCPEGVGVVADVPDAFGDVRVLENGLKGLAVVGRGGEGKVAEGQDVDDTGEALGVDEDGGKGETSMAAEVVAF